MIARGAQWEATVVEVELRHGDLSGFGEAAPIERYGESPESALAWLEAIELGRRPVGTRADRGGAPTWTAGGTIRTRLRAPRPTAGKIVGFPGAPLARSAVSRTPQFVDRCGSEILTRWRDALTAAGRGFRRLKLKLGGRDGLDLERVRSVRSATTDPLQVDVNEYWSLEEALEWLPRWTSSIANSRSRGATPRAPELKRRSPVPVFVDEDCHTLADVAFCAERAHGLTVKLAKSGGIREAVRIVHAARALGLGTMLGCMVESGPGSPAGCTRQPLRSPRSRRQPR